jgi:hypothetical protein
VAVKDEEGFGVHDTGYRIQDAGCRMQEVGYYSIQILM